MDYIKELDTAISFIENNLDSRLDLDRISRQVSISSFHFHRIFKAVVHETVMDYVRSRRLTESLQDLVRTNQRIIDIAMKYQFETQQSFTRSFKSYFGITPGKARKDRTGREHNGRPAFSVRVLEHVRDIDRERPSIVEVGPVKLIGVQKYLNLKVNIDEGIAPKAWNELMNRIGEVDRRNGRRNYGVQRYPNDFGPENNVFEYIAAVEVSEFGDIPEGMIAFELPRRHYAVYTYRGEVGPDTMTQIYANIYGQWVFNLEHDMYCDYDFEFYDEKFNPGQPDSYMSVYIPVKVNE